MILGIAAELIIIIIIEFGSSWYLMGLEMFAEVVKLRTQIMIIKYTFSQI